jgi:hypothetical protein
LGRRLLLDTWIDLAGVGFETWIGRDRCAFLGGACQATDIQSEDGSYSCCRFDLTQDFHGKPPSGCRDNDREAAMVSRDR